MTSVFGTLVLVAMTGLTITNQHRSTETAGKALDETTAFVSDEANARELEKALAKEDEALLASYERYQQHPRNVRHKQEMAVGTDPLLVNSVYSSGASEFVAKSGGGEDPSRRPRAVIRTTTTGRSSVVDEDDATTTIEPMTTTLAAQEERPFDFYDPSLTADQKRGYVKKVVYFSFVSSIPRARDRHDLIILWLCCAVVVTGNSAVQSEMINGQFNLDEATG